MHAQNMHLFFVALTKRQQPIARAGQNHIYTVYKRYFWQGNHQTYGHIQCEYTVLADPTFNIHDTNPRVSPP